MKNTYLILTLFLIGTVLVGAGVWFYNLQTSINLLEILAFSSIGLLITFSLYVAFKRYKSEREGLPGEDELSTRVSEKAASRAFMAGIYIWSMFYVFTVDSNINAEILLGIGMIGMVLSYAGFWLYFNKTGVDHG